MQTVTPSYYIYLKKSSADTSMTNGDNRYSLEGAVYTVYSGNTAVATIATDASGYGYTNVALQNGRYSIKETTSPKNYYKDETTHWVTISYGDAALNVSDAPIPLEYSINLTKTSANVSITNGDSGYSLAGAVCKIYNSFGTEVASITTNSSGKGSSNVKLKNGTYTAVESKAPPGYALDTTRHTVRINNADAILNVSDVPLIKTVTLTKTSANTSITAGNSNYSLAGAVYDVYEGNSATGTPVASFTTNSSGVATLSRKLYPNRTYTILERTPPPGYVKDTTPHPFYLTYNAATMDVVDDPTTIRLTVKKKDSETNTSVAQGNASLAGAQYKVTYVNGTKTVENIVTTNSSGSATLRGLPIGVTVTVQEITAPAGYKLDSRVHTYVTTTKTEKIEYVLEPEDFTEDVFKGHIQITKQIEMLGADAQLEQGAEYQVYLKSAGSYANAKDTERDYLVTGADGKSITKDLPYGTYTMTISMTDDGLAEINTANTAYDNDNGKLYAGYSNYTLRIRYDAKLNSDESLVYGDNGNKNEVVLTWKRTNDTYYDTLIDDAHIYTYATNITKTFSDGKAEQTMFDNVLFKAQNASDGYYVIAQLNEDEGIWYVTGHTDKEASATAMHPVEWNGKKGQIILKGVEDDQYIWTELETANGYTLLKNNIDVTITSVDDANRPCDIYSKDTLGVIQNDPRYNFPNNEDYKLANIPQKQLAHNYQTASATVDGNDVTMLDDEMDAGSKNAIAPLQVVNTRGFETPMTGENGTWALAIGGVLVFCLGTSAFIFFLVFKRRKEQEDK